MNKNRNANLTFKSAISALSNNYIACVLLCLIFLASCTGISGNKDLLNPGQMSLAPLKSEAFSKSELSRQDRRIKRDFGGIYSNTNLQNYLTGIAQKIWVISGVIPPKEKVAILDTPSINAFSLPGGRLYVTRGLLALANDEAEIAAILAHEISHVLAKHATARIEREKQAKLVKQVLTEVVTNEEETNISLASVQASFARFSQEQELEADALGIALAQEAGYDPSGAVRFLKSLKAMIDLETRPFSEGNKEKAFFGSHPPTIERITKAENRISTLPTGGKIDRKTYLAHINGIPYGYDANQGLIKGQTFLHKKLGIQFQAPKDYVLKNTPDAVFASGPNERIIRFDLDTIPKNWTLSEYMLGSWIKNGEISEFKTYQMGKTVRATAQTSVKGWTFHMGIIQEDKTLYRFVLAEKGQKNQTSHAIIQKIIQEFRILSNNEKRALTGQKLIIKERNGELNTSKLTQSMLVATDANELFQVINGLKSTRRLSELEYIKYIAN